MTPKQLTFAKAILAGKNQRQAAIEAGDPEKSAAQSGYRMMRQKAVVHYVEQQKAFANGEIDRAPDDPKPKVPKKAAKPVAIHTLAKNYDDPVEFLRAAMNETTIPINERVKCAISLLPYTHGKLRTGSTSPKLTKRQQDEINADNAMNGIFGTADQVGSIQ